MKEGTNNATFTLNFIVTEESSFVTRHSVDAVVNVTVKEIPEEAVDSSGSIRFAGITAEEFVTPVVIINNNNKKFIIYLLYKKN